MNMDYIQKIYFGSAGVGKSYKVEKDIVCKELGIYTLKDDGKYTIEIEKEDGENKDIQVNINNDNCIKTVFHPEYSYRDFMVKISPLTTKDNKVQYEHNEGDFLKALAKAYKNILEADNTDEAQKVALVIDEINRGNSAEIFGSVFQLLDREDDGWSSYAVNISNMEFNKLIELLNIEKIEVKENEIIIEIKFKFQSKEITNKDIKNLLMNKQIKLPPNLSIIGTMNSSDESIYYMDSAFKRRWDWEYMDIKDKSNKKPTSFNTEEDWTEWKKFINNLNDFIKDEAKSIRRVEDKLIGYYFLKYNTEEAIKNKLMFFLWDNVFARDKKPLKTLLGGNIELITFGDFTRQVETFIKKI